MKWHASRQVVVVVVARCNAMQCSVERAPTTTPRTRAGHTQVATMQCNERNEHKHKNVRTRVCKADIDDRSEQRQRQRQNASECTARVSYLLLCLRSCGVGLGPVGRRLVVERAVREVLLGDLRVLRVLRLRGRQQRHDGQEHRLQRQRGRPRLRGRSEERTQKKERNKHQTRGCS